MNAIITVTNLRRTFGERAALDGLSFEVHPGEVFGLLGPNGAGKTTTVRLLNGLLPPSGGSVRVFGLDPGTQGDEVRRQTGVLTETPALYERLSAHQNLRFFGTLAGVAESELDSRVDELLGFFELSGRADDKVETFSKGMKQRLALARALIHRPPLLFLDEPTAGLDPEAAQQVDDLIEDLGRRNGQSVVLCTHNLTEAQRLCDRVAVLNQGQALAIGGLEELARTLWPVTWVDLRFAASPSAKLIAGLGKRPGVLQVEAADDRLAIQLESETAIPDLVRDLSAAGAQILRVIPREYSLEEIYFSLQQKQQAGVQ